MDLSTPFTVTIQTPDKLGEALGLALRLGDRDAEGLVEGVADCLGLRLADGERDADGEREKDGLRLGLALMLGL